MKIIVTKDTVKIEEFDLVHEGEHKVNKCSFSFSAEYTKELVKKAIFTSQNSSVEVAIINNECDIPTEILRARNIVLLGVYAYKVTEDKLDLRYSPSPDAFNVNNGSYIEGASDSEEITPSQFEQYMQAMNDGLNKVEKSLTKMDEATSSANDLVDDINQKLENGDFIGPQGPQGVQGTPGKDGINGADGVGITTITSGQSTVEEDKTITPVTVQKTDGSSQIFKVEAKNGQDGKDGLNGKDGVNGQNGQDGITPTIGENGNWYLGDTDTGKPSRGEVGPTPDLTDYVKNTDYASASKAGVLKINGNAARISSDGVLSAAEVSEEQYKTTVNSIFISKGTLDNVKNFLVESSIPVITLNNTLDNLVRKNRVSDYIVSLKDALKYKLFEFLVHGKVKQETTSGKNLYNAEETYNWTGNIGWHFIDGSIGAHGTNIGDKTTLKAPVEQGVTYTFSVNTIISSPSESTQTPLRLVYGDESNIANVSDGNYSYTFTATKTGYVLLRLYINEDNSTVTISNIQLEEGSAATSYEPYTGGQPSPSSDYPQEITTLTFDKITRCGKNLYELRDYERTVIGMNLKIENQILSLDGTSNNTWFSIGNVSNQNNIPRLKKDEDYTVTFISTFNKDLNCTLWNDVGNVIIQGVQCNPVKANSKSSFTFKCSYDEILTNFRIAFAGFTVGEAVQGTMQIMIEPGTQATEYEPYQATEYAIDLQGNEMVEIPNGVKDELVIDKYGNVNLIKNVGKIILDGSEDWTCTNNKVYTLLADINLPWCDVTDVPNIISDMFITDKNGNTFSRNNIISTYIPTQQYNYQKLVISKYDFNGDVDMFKSFLSTHNVIVYYQLANPQTILLGKLIDIITTLNGTNNISINGNIPTTISTTYALDIKKYIDKKLAEISSAVIEEG